MNSIILLLDQAQLEQPMFMKLFAQKLRTFKNHRLILIHPDNKYTKELIEHGAEPKQAKERAIKEINLKLISLLADQNIPAIGYHGYQRNTVCKNESGSYDLDSSLLKQHPDSVALVFSTLILDKTKNEVDEIEPLHLAQLLKKELQFDEIFCFAVSEKLNLSFEKQPPSLADCLNFVPKVALKGSGVVKMLTIADFDEKKGFSFATTV